MPTLRTPTPSRRGPLGTTSPPTPARLGTLIGLGACVLGACGLAAAPAQAKEYTHTVEYYEIRAKGTVTDHRITDGGELTDDLLLSVPFESRAGALRLVDGVPREARPVQDHASSQPTTYERTLTERDRGGATCQAGSWPTPSGGQAVITDLTGPKGGWEASFKPADRFDGPSTCSGWASGLYDGPTSGGGTQVDVRFEVPKTGVTEEPIRIEADGEGSMCPPAGYPSPFALCSSRYIATLYVRRTFRDTYTDDKPPATGAPEETTTKPGGGVGILSGLKGSAGRKDGTVTGSCATACTGTVSAYAVALSKQGKAKGKAKLVGTGRLQRLKAGASPRTTSGPVRVGARIRFDRRDRRALRRATHVEYRVEARPTAGGERVRSTVRARVPRG